MKWTGLSAEVTMLVGRLRSTVKADHYDVLEAALERAYWSGFRRAHIKLESYASAVNAAVREDDINMLKLARAAGVQDAADVLGRVVEKVDT